MANVPVISPEGVAGEVPAEKLTTALARGFKRALVMTSPEGQEGYVPVEKARAALDKGFKPGQAAANAMADKEHEGFWKSIGSDLGGMAASAAIANPATLPMILGKQAYDEAHSVATTGNSVEGQRVRDRLAAGHGVPYALDAGAAELSGANVGGMERAAASGDPNGVIGHASAVPTAMAGLMGVSRLPVGSKALYRPLLDPVYAAADRTFAPGTPEQLMVKAIRPPVTTPELDTAMTRQMGNIYQTGESMGRPVKNLSNYQAATDAAKSQANASYQGMLRPNAKIPVDLKPAMISQMRSIPATDLAENPDIVPRTLKKAQTYNRTAPLEEADAIREDTNAKLKDFYNKAGGDRNAALSNPETARIKAVNDSVRQVVYNELRARTGADPEPIQQSYGDLSEISDASAKRGVVYGRQAPVSLADQVAIATKGIKAFITTKLLKTYNNPDTIVRIAYERWAQQNGITPSWTAARQPLRPAPSSGLRPALAVGGTGRTGDQ